MKTLKITPWLEMEAGDLEVNSKKEFTRRELEKLLAQKSSEDWRLPTTTEALALGELCSLGVGEMGNAPEAWKEYWLAENPEDAGADTIFPTLFFNFSENPALKRFLVSFISMNSFCRARLVRDINPKA